MAVRTLSDQIAERVIQLRKEMGLTREEFVERCRRVGGDDFSVGAMANIETGRRNQTGERRRKITADELAVFASVLQVPPVWLCADPRTSAPSPVLGATTANPWRALAWMIGTWPLDESPGSGWAEPASHLGRLRDLWMHIQQYDLLRHLYDPQFHAEPPVGPPEEETLRKALLVIWERMDAFRITGMPMPPVPEHITEGISEALLGRVQEEIGGVQELLELRATAREWVPGDSDPDHPSRQERAATADAKALRRLSEALRRVTNWGLPLPPIPDEILARAKELDVNLTPWLEADA